MAAYHGKFLSLLIGPFDGIITLYVVTLKVAHFIIIFRNSGSSRSNGNNWVIPTQLDINNRRLIWTMFQYPIRRLIIRSRKFLNPLHLYLKSSDWFEFEKHIASTASEVPVKFLSNTNSLIPDLAPSRLCEISRKNALSDIETRPNWLCRKFEDSRGFCDVRCPWETRLVCL